MTLQNIINYSAISSEIKVRLKIATFMVLLFQFTNEIYPTSENALLFYAFYILLEISSMVVVYRFSGNSAVGKDINELNLYALFIHILRIPVYYLTEMPMEIFKYAIWALLIASALRLFYFKQSKSGEYQGIKIFLLLEFIRNKFARKREQFNYWSELLFFGTAIPLWLIIYKTNDQSVTITVIGLMLFIYFISDVIKTQSSFNGTPTNSAQLDSDAILLLQNFNAKPAAEKAQILKLVATDTAVINNSGTVISDEAQHKLSAATDTVFELRFWFAMLMVIAAVGGLGLVATMNFYKVSFFDAGYSVGFNDAKSGTAPKKETNFQKALDCIEMNRAHFPLPTDAGCPAPAKPWR